jgi:CheY-like chemotaxis protein
VGTAKVLVVDDEDLVREASAEMLIDEGYEVLVAASADEALKLLAREPFDIVVSDVRMPRKDGFALAAEARQIWPQLPFVFITGYMLSPENVEGSTGSILWKPFKQRELIDLVERTLRDGR